MYFLNIQRCHFQVPLSLPATSHDFYGPQIVQGKLACESIGLIILNQRINLQLLARRLLRVHLRSRIELPLLFLVALVFLLHRPRLLLPKVVGILLLLLTPFWIVNLMFLSPVNVLRQRDRVVLIDLNIFQILFAHFKSAILALVLLVTIWILLWVDEVLVALANMNVLDFLLQFAPSFDHIDYPGIVLRRKYLQFILNK